MPSEIVKIYFDKFKGIRKSKPISDPFNGVMSALDMKNIDLKYSGNSDAVGIYSMSGNFEFFKLQNENEEIIAMFKSTGQINNESKDFWFIYTADNNENKGRLYLFDKELLSLKLLSSDLTLSKYANGITVNQGFYDYFFFTNGIDAPLAINMGETEENQVTIVNATDYEGRAIRGLALESYDGRVVMSSKNRIHWSKQGDIFDWSTIASVATDSAYQELDKDVTALSYYNNSLVVFTNDYSVSFSGNPGVSSSFLRSGASGGGCASFNSVIKFDNKLYYYDNVAKNIFAYYLYDSGQMRPSDGVANDIFDYFINIDNKRIKEVSFYKVLISGKNEIWLKIPKKGGGINILILDYIKGEWVLRDSQDINQIFIYDEILYSCFKNKILKEYVNNTFDNEFRGSEYSFSIINLGSDANLKIPKGRIFFTLDNTVTNDFFIEFIRDGNELRKKVKRLSRKLDENTLKWVDTDEDLSGGHWVEDELDESGKVWLKISDYDELFKIPPISLFRQLKIRIYTKEKGQGFGIKRIEFSKIKIKRAK